MKKWKKWGSGKNKAEIYGNRIEENVKKIGNVENQMRFQNEKAKIDKDEKESW